MTRKILTKGGLEWVSCRASSTKALARDLRPPVGPVEEAVFADVVTAAQALERANLALQEALGMKP